MRADDIRCAPQTPSSHMTQGMYMPPNRKYNVMSNEQLRRGLCPKSGGRWEACKACQGGCQAGKLLVDRMEGRSQEPKEKVRDTKEFALNLIRPEDRDVPVMTKAEAAMAVAGIPLAMAEAEPKRTRVGNPKINEAMRLKHEKAMEKYVRVMRRVAEGEDLEEACKAEGYSGKKVWLRHRGRNEKECMDALEAAGVPDIDVRRRKR